MSRSFKVILSATLLLLNFLVVISAQTQYILTDADVEVDETGSLLSCSKSFSPGILHVIIPDTLDGVAVRSIASQAWGGIFDGSLFDTLTLPAHLESIGRDAIMENGLEHVDFSRCEDLRTIGSRSFYNNDLQTLDLSNCLKLEEIGGAAFLYNDLSTLDLSMCVMLEYIGFNCFLSNQLTSVMLPENDMLSLSFGCFGDNQIESFNGKPSDGIIYDLSNGVTDSTYIISYGGGKKVIDFLPDSITRIAERAFAYQDLTSVDLSDCKTLTFIERGGFQSNNLSEVDLTECSSLIEIGEDAFFDNSLSEFTLPFEPVIPRNEFLRWENHLGVVILPENGIYTANNVRNGYLAILHELPKKLSMLITWEGTPVEGAQVSLDGYGTRMTGSDGEVTYDTVYAGEIDYTIETNEYGNHSGTLTMENEDRTITVELGDPVTGSLQNSFTNKIKYWPNPADQRLNLSAATALTRLEVINLQGRQVIQLSNPGAESNVDVSFLPSGVYIVKAIDEHYRLTTFMFVKE